MKRFCSKRGMTLAELIMSLAVSVVIIGAACSALYFGSQSAKSGAAAVADHGNAKLVETYFQDILPTASSVSVSNTKLSDKDSDVWNFYFDSGKNLVVEKNGARQMSVEGIDGIDFTIGNAGNCTRLDYVIHSQDAGNGFALSGGVVLNNSVNTGESSTQTLSSTAPGNLYLNVRGEK
jgi:prepilin-type N-terminal cleavage/methylation domain-containing protein